MENNENIPMKDIAEVLVVITFTVALIVCVIWLVPGNNGFSGSWFQASAAGFLTIAGACNLMRTPKGSRVKPTNIFFSAGF